MVSLTQHHIFSSSRHGFHRLEKVSEAAGARGRRAAQLRQPRPAFIDFLGSRVETGGLTVKTRREQNI